MEEFEVVLEKGIAQSPGFFGYSGSVYLLRIRQGTVRVREVEVENCAGP